MSEPRRLDPRRHFTAAQRTALYLAANGRCEHCGERLEAFDADHLTPHSRGGLTEMANGAASCPRCNRSRKDSMNSHLAPTTRHPVRPLPASLELRAWQQEAVPRVLSCSEQSFLLAATPGGGKTIPALVIAHRLLRSGEISRIVVVAPTSHLTRQWADDAHRLGINLTPRWEGQREPTNFHGIAITYQRVRHGALALAAGCREAAD